MSEQKLGRVYLVGAGCGSADLITLRGKRLLEQCDAVVYDDLIDPSLLDLAPIGAEWRYLGKRCGKHSAPQGDISAALIALAQEGKTVVRLKGGDPFVFGRGGEELLALNRAGVPCEEVPGITSAVAIPAGAGIPVTHRGLSRSVHIITGHTAHTPDGLPENFAALARCGGTLVFLMGLGHLEAIARRLLEEGRAPDTPVAVVSRGEQRPPRRRAGHPGGHRSACTGCPGPRCHCGGGGGRPASHPGGGPPPGGACGWAAPGRGSWSGPSGNCWSPWAPR